MGASVDPTSRRSVAPVGSGRLLGPSGRFELLEKLGEGGMGVVYRARDRELQSEVALKTLARLDLEGDADALLRFKNEFRSLADLHHPNLVSLGELFEHDGEWFFTMELVDGEDFVSHVRVGQVGSTSGAAAGTTVDAAGAAGAADAKTHPTSGRGDPSSRSTLATRPASRSQMRASAEDASPTEQGYESSVQPIAPPVDEARLYSLAAQLGRGLLALHAHGKVHRDIKPSNILVSRAGQVKILDFGLVMDRTEAGVWARGLIVGTPTYMAPEQALALPVGPEADWYAVGAVLYMALTGTPPFVGSPELLMRMKQLAEPVSPSERVPSVSAELDAITMALLRREPAERMTGPALLERLEERRRPTSSRPPGQRKSDPPPSSEFFVGRSDELAECARVFDDAERGQVTLRIFGESGVGKTTLATKFCERIRIADRNAIILRGRCYERESVPFKAIDGIIDALSAVLLEMPAPEVAELMPPDARLLAHTFPVLRRGPWGLDGAVAIERMSPDAVRRRLFFAFRTLLERLTAKSRVAIVIDDLQWSDADSMAFLRSALLPPNAPPVFLMTTLRARSHNLETETSTVDVWLPGDVRDLELAGLRKEEAELLAARLLGADDGNASALAEEAGGHPLFIDELVRHTRGVHSATHVRLDQALVARVRRLPSEQIDVLTLAAVGGAPLPLQTLAFAAGVEVGELVASASALRAGNFVRTSGNRATDRLEPYHDRVRSAVLLELDAGTRRRMHERLAEALERAGDAEPESLATHWREAGDAARAHPHALTTAERAAALSAFERAARFYGIALEGLPPGDPRAPKIRALAADMLTSAGRSVDAAEAYLAASAETSDGQLAMEWRRRAAHQYVATGFFERGIAEMTSVLAAVGVHLPKTLFVALFLMILGRVRVRLRGLGFRPRPESEVSPLELHRIDTCWAASSAISLVDMIRGSHVQARHMLFALRAREPVRVCRALCLEIAFAAANGSGGRKRVDALMAIMESQLDALGRPMALRAMVLAARGAVACLLGDFRDTVTMADEAEALLTKEWTDLTRWELDSLRVFAMGARNMLGKIRELRATLPAVIDDAIARKNVHVATYLRTGCYVLVWLAGDDVDEVRATVEEAIVPWSRRSAASPTPVPRVIDAIGRAYLEMYAQDPVAAYAALRRGLGLFESVFLVNCQLFRVQVTSARACTALALATAKPDLAPGLVREARRAALRLSRERARWSAPLGSLALAAVYRANGDDRRAEEELARAVLGFEREDMALYAAAARRRWGEHIGGEKGRALIGESEAWMRDQTVRDPERLTDVIAPGFRIARLAMSDRSS
jgi:serine/threonine protein kinase